MAQQVEVGDAIARVPRCCGGHGGGCEQEAGQGVAGADAGGGSGCAVLCGPSRLYEVRHQVPRAWHALRVQAVAGPDGAGATVAGGHVLGSHVHLPHSGQASSAITGRCRVAQGPAWKAPQKPHQCSGLTADTAVQAADRVMIAVVMRDPPNPL